MEFAFVLLLSQHSVKMKNTIESPVISKQGKSLTGALRFRNTNLKRIENNSGINEDKKKNQRDYYISRVRRNWQCNIPSCRTIDVIAFYTFFCLFLFFNVVYWCVYVIN